jgi:hypothetical protein
VTGAFGRRPLLEPDQVAWLGVEQMATAWEREHAGRLGLHVTSSQALAADPPGGPVRRAPATGLEIIATAAPMPVTQPSAATLWADPAIAWT